MKSAHPTNEASSLASVDDRAVKTSKTGLLALAAIWTLSAEEVTSTENDLEKVIFNVFVALFQVSDLLLTCIMNFCQLN